MIHPISSIQARIQNFTLKHFCHTKYGRYMRKIHNSHLGESCFIIGNGPSLTKEDLATLHEKNIDTFAVNRIFKIFPETEWRPTYYVSTDAVLIRDTMEDVDNIPARIKFVPLQNKFYLGINVKGAKYFFRNDNREDDQPEGFSLDCTRQVNTLGTVTIDCIQLAMHMGYKQIYLLGIDHNFDKIITESGEVIIDPSVKNYFIEGYDADIINEVKHDLGSTTKAYFKLRSFVDKTDVTILNASRQTKLTAFERTSFEDALNRIQNCK